jgi:ribosome biogenesis GTPase / thiamine phosphate phosphatase
MPEPLDALGWDVVFATSLEQACPGGEPGRVARVDRGGWITLATADGDVRARLHPRFRRPADPLQRPTVGDWVAVPAGNGAEPIIETVLPRRSVIVRNTGGDDRDVSQALAANVDTAFLALPLDGDRNPRRTDRFIALARSGGVAPVLVLTKADCCEPDMIAQAEDEAHSHGVPVHVVSARSGTGLDSLEAHLPPGCTVVLLGVSGAGKSTLVNRLLGREALAVGALRAEGRGRHTTTHRALIPLERGAVLIDTPGLRSVSTWDPGIDDAFADIAEISADCRFADCAHEHEPGCAIRDALASGVLDPDRWESYRRLRAEEQELASRRTAARRRPAGPRPRRG